MAVLLGPVQLWAIELQNDKMTGRVLRELHHASDSGAIRVLDALAIQKSKDGAISTLAGSDLTPDQRVAYGAILGALLGLGATGTDAGAAAGAQAGAETFANQNFGLTAADIQEIAADVPPGTTAVLIMFEHRWALPLKDAIVDAGGVVVAQGMVRPETLMAIGANRYAAMTAPPASDTSPGSQRP
jgi:uncharacterized membrane protein